MAYMETADGFFRPDEPLTCTEAARMFFALGMPPGIIPEGDEPVTRAEFAEMLYAALGEPPTPAVSGLPAGEGFSAAFFSADNLLEAIPATIFFTDVSEHHPRQDAIAYCYRSGWLSGYPDGSFLPEKPISRAEAAFVTQRALNRNTAAGNEKMPPFNAPGKNNAEGVYHDVPPTHWAAAAIHAAAEPSAEANELNGYLYQIIAGQTTAEMTTEEKHRAIYVYIRDNYRYFQGEILERGAVGWEDEFALNFFKTRRGNCYSFAAGYGLLLRKLGYEVNIVSGSVFRTDDSPHGWAEFIRGGVTYIDDPELEMSYGGDDSKVLFYSFPYGEWPVTPDGTAIEYRK
jgi:hypothetical protein